MRDERLKTDGDLDRQADAMEAHDQKGRDESNREQAIYSQNQGQNVDPKKAWPKDSPFDKGDSD